MKSRLIATLLMSFGLSLLMSCWVTFLNLGLTDVFFEKWMDAFRLAWPAAAVIAFLLGPPVQKATAFLTSRTP
ncbi:MULTISPECIES: DUF2798 domain-containing protein [unclassified Roseibium]|uniref:DUF2798 domain-containing protein n=1 Tax=unclassified Roseibium TaxID=2629323 RepID=UPI00316FE42E